MDAVSRSGRLPRTSLLFDAYPFLRTRDRPPPDERVDVPAIDESTRVSFSKDAGLQAGLALRSATMRQLSLYEQVQNM